MDRFSKAVSTPKVALAHDWLTGMRGGEKVLEIFADLFPKAPIYTLLHVPGSVSEKIESHPIHTSFLQKLPMAEKRYRYYLPFMPALVEGIEIEPVDLVISISSCVVKSVIAPVDAKHASYVLSPMRYIYDRYDDYFAADRAGFLTRQAMKYFRPRLQKWDRRTAKRVDSMMGISSFIADRIRDCYGRSVPVIYPPVEVERFAVAKRKPDDYYLIVSALVPYKNVDIAIEAFRGLDRKLVVAGAGPLYDKFKANCPPNVELRGWVDQVELPDLVAGCRAFLFPQVEDFGIAPVEAMAAGRPVIALGHGGSLDTVCDVDRFFAGMFRQSLGPTGLFFDKTTPKSLADAVRRYEQLEHIFDPVQISTWSKRFDRHRFIAEIQNWISSVMNEQQIRKAA